METKTDESYGVIPVIKDASGKWQIFLINQLNRFGGTFWGFPKGHSEVGESEELAARRELLEETNLEIDKLEVSHPFVQKYSFIDDGVLINKTVTYFLGYVRGKEYQVQSSEVAEAKWCDFELAKNQITHDNNLELLEEVNQFLINKN